jgi:hypothetical protein
VPASAGPLVAGSALSQESSAAACGRRPAWLLLNCRWSSGVCGSRFRSLIGMPPFARRRTGSSASMVCRNPTAVSSAADREVGSARIPDEAVDPVLVRSLVEMANSALAGRRRREKDHVNQPGQAGNQARPGCAGKVLGHLDARAQVEATEVKHAPNQVPPRRPRGS